MSTIKRILTKHTKMHWINSRAKSMEVADRLQLMGIISRTDIRSKQEGIYRRIHMLPSMIQGIIRIRFLMLIDGKIVSMNSHQLNCSKNNNINGDNNSNSNLITTEVIAMDKGIIIIITLHNSSNLENLLITMGSNSCHNSSSRNSNNTNKDNPKGLNHKGNINNILLLFLKLLQCLNRTTITSSNMQDHNNPRFLLKISIITLIRIITTVLHSC